MHVQQKHRNENLKFAFPHLFPAPTLRHSSIVFVEKKLAFLFPMKGNICSRRFIVYTVFLVPEKQKKTGEERERLSDRSKRNKTRGKKAKEFCLEFTRKLLITLK